MNFTAKSKFGPQRLAVQWLDTPAVGPLLICRRKAGQGCGPVARRCSAAAPRSAWAVRGCGPLGRLRAFTLLELMLVIAIIGFIAALTLPHVAGFGQANSMATATRQLLDDVALARQRAMVNRSTVYMVFLPPEFWNSPSFSQIPYSQQVSNLLMHQYSTYALVSLATVGDQPGQHHPQYVTDWRVLPSGVFIAPFEFTLTNAITNIITTNTLAGTTVLSSIYPWTWVTVPFPSLYSTYMNSFGTVTYTPMTLPSIGFTPQGSLTPPSDARQYEYIALARGSIFYPTDTNGVPLFEPPNLSEVPPGNDVKNPNLIQIDLMTARPTLVQNRFQ
jgi:prepilin-type N-terminal cleavage/methylation domain-containing protein